MRVLLIDQAGSLGALCRPLFEQGDLVLAGTAKSHAEAAQAVSQTTPEVVIVGVDAHGKGALEAIEAIMGECPVPLVALRYAGGGGLDLFQLLSAGALEVVELPTVAGFDWWKQLARTLTVLARVRVVRHVRGRRKERKAQRALPPTEKSRAPLVVIGASLGGPRALGALLRALPSDFPAAVAICQHISDGFTGALAQWLSQEASLPVREAKDGEALAPGLALLAPAGVGAHLVVRSDGCVHLERGAPYGGFLPSCDKLLSSAASAYRSRAAGVLLTGMGRDGAGGLLEVRRQGGHTIAQDESSSVVFGMPREAVNLGAAVEVLPLDKIAAALCSWVERC